MGWVELIGNLFKLSILVMQEFTKSRDAKAQQQAQAQQQDAQFAELARNALARMQTDIKAATSAANSVQNQMDNDGPLAPRAPEKAP